MLSSLGLFVFRAKDAKSLQEFSPHQGSLPALSLDKGNQVRQRTTGYPWLR